MNRKEWIREHELKWSDSLALTESQRTRFQESALKELTDLLEKEEIAFNIAELEIEDIDSQRESSQMIKIEVAHDCLEDIYVYSNQIDFTSDRQTFHFEFWGYLDPDALIEEFIAELINKIKNCG